uniref:Uncharacterized protein n=1 Tax=Anguilla anguilla TaxID=7936 RepID=A0A0E9QR45_ANGAN
MTTAVKTTNSAYQNKIHIFVHRKVHRMGYIGYLAVEILPHTALQKSFLLSEMKENKKIRRT